MVPTGVVPNVAGPLNLKINPLLAKLPEIIWSCEPVLKRASVLNLSSEAPVFGVEIEPVAAMVIPLSCSIMLKTKTASAGCGVARTRAAAVVEAPKRCQGPNFGKAMNNSRRKCYSRRLNLAEGSCQLVNASSLLINDGACPIDAHGAVCRLRNSLTLILTLRPGNAPGRPSHCGSDRPAGADQWCQQRCGAADRLKCTPTGPSITAVMPPVLAAPPATGAACRAQGGAACSRASRSWRPSTRPGQP